MIAIPVALGTAAVILLALIDAGIVIAGVAFVVLILPPGAALASWLVPSARIGSWPWLLVTLGLGVSLGILIGMALDQTPLGVRATPGVLFLVSGFSMAVFAIRQRDTWQSIGRWKSVGRESVGSASLIAVSLLLAVTAFGISRVGFDSVAPSALTQLWLLRAADGSLDVGVANEGREPSTYRLVLRSGQQDLMEWPGIVLEPGRSWRQSVPTATLPETELRAILYRSDKPEMPFREVHVSNPKGPG